MEIIENAFKNIDLKAVKRTDLLIMMTEYEHALKVLQDEKDSIDKALKDTEKWHSHKESWKRQKKKSEQLNRAIEKLKL